MTKSLNLAGFTETRPLRVRYSPLSCAGNASLSPLSGSGSPSPLWFFGEMLSSLSIVIGISSVTPGGSTAGPTSLVHNFVNVCDFGCTPCHPPVLHKNGVALVSPLDRQSRIFVLG